MKEVDTWHGLAERFRTDTHFRTSVQGHFSEELKRRTEEEPEKLAEFLDALSGIADFAIKGTVYRPRCTRAFGDWIIVPDDRHPDIIGKEEIETNNEWPYHKGEVSFTIRSSYVNDHEEVVVNAEEAVEDGNPRIFYPNRLERFDLLRLRGGNILFERDRAFEERMIRRYFPQG